MNPLRKLIPEIIEGSPIKALLVMFVVCAYPAIQVHIAEWRDSIDASASTAWQPELVLDAWFDGLRTFGLALYAYWTRSGTKDSP